jgi:SAM-dependent methyltransferase
MLAIARERAAKEDLEVKFLQQDMRSLSLRGRFDLVTCWFDSLNYLLEVDDLAQAFAGVSRALDKNGIFIFDVNTIRALAVEWVREPCYVHLDSRDLFLASVPQYDPATKIASLHITGFARENERWVRVDEVHKERGYTLKEIRQCLKRAHLRELACWASLDKMEKPGRSSVRVWFVARRQLPRVAQETCQSLGLEDPARQSAVTPAARQLVTPLWIVQSQDIGVGLEDAAELRLVGRVLRKPPTGLAVDHIGQHAGIVSGPLPDPSPPGLDAGPIAIGYS